MTTTITMTRATALTVGALLLAGCPSTSGPLPDLPAPEYEEPRSYEPDKPIDSLEGGGDQVAPDAPPPGPIEAPEDAAGSDAAPPSESGEAPEEAAPDSEATLEASAPPGPGD